ncbi:MAG: DNA adenine methylase [Selenomonadaceae bacterium]|nr:DNA adenine methylase [Selenomonadaceae bacterium]
MIRPIVKWLGGKRQLLDDLIPLIESIRPRGSVYVEPFLGGGAVLFGLQPSRAIVNDLNSDLINVYETVRDRTDALIERLKEHELNHCKEYYYAVRSWDRSEDYRSMSAVERAARLIYLHRTCYNGLYRVNKSGHFNVPIGRYEHPTIVSEQSIRAVAEYLQRNDVTLCNEDYRAVTARLDGNIFVYFDPPYQPLSQSSSFTSYTDQNFLYDQQLELRDLCCELRARDIPFVESNSDCDEIRSLYEGFEIETVRATRALNSVGSKRGAINELLIYYRRRGGD